MVVERCSFTTERLLVEDWHRTGADSLPGIVAALLTPAVTRSLPPDWGDRYDEARAERWIAERDAEGTALLVTELGDPVGLLLLHEEPVRGGVEVRLGYLLAERAWGRGLGGELIAGLLRWCRTQSTVQALVGGVAHDNIASIRILERNGFSRTIAAPTIDGELEYRLDS